MSSFNHFFRSSFKPISTTFHRTLANQPRLRIFSNAPNFKASTTAGEIDFHDYINNSWAVLFSHPKDFTPVCTTELGSFSALKPEFDKRNVKLLGLSVQDLKNHDKWIKDIEEVAIPNNEKFAFPIIADVDGKVSFLYDMFDEETFKKIGEELIQTVRSVFVIDDKKKIRTILTYPASVGRNSNEVLRIVDALQTGDKNGVVTPINWKVGEDVIIPPTVSDEAAKAKFGEFKKVKPYLRYTSLK